MKRKKDLHPDHIRGIKRVTKSPHHKTRISKTLRIIVLIGLGLSILVLLGGLYWQSKTKPTSQVINKNINQALNALSSNGVASVTQTQQVQSSLGFSLSFDPSQFNVTGQVTDASSTNNYVTGETYQESELTQRRPYSIITVHMKAEPSLYMDYAYMTVIANIRKSFWANHQNPGESEIDALVRYNSDSYKASDGWQASPPQDVTIAGNKFKKIIYNNTKTYGSISVTNRTTVYLTTQNDRPYIVTEYNSGDDNQDQVNLLDSVLATIKFENLDPSQLAYVPSENAVLGASTNILDSGDSNTPYNIDSSTIFNVILRNQPAVVRVATVSCADVQLTSPQDTETLKNACAAELGSGSIVSDDGYVATNGHVVTITNQAVVQGYIYLAETQDALDNNLNQILDFLIKSGLLTESDYNALMDQYNSDQISTQKLVDAFLKIIPDSTISVSNQKTSYYLQLGNDAMRLKMENGRYMVPTSKTIITANLIAKDFDSSALQGDMYSGNSSASDVALLKADGNFPVIDTGSVANLKSGAVLTAMGYPAFVDGGFFAKSDKTKPTITQGQVVQIEQAGSDSGHLLIITSVPIAQGNSGGPAFDTSGLQIGLNTYSDINCPDMKCFGSGIARNIADFLALVKKQGISLNTNSSITDYWNKGLDDYTKGDYKEAAKNFKAAQAQYPAHYLAARMVSLTDSKIGTVDDHSSEYQSNGNIKIVIAGSVILTLIAGSAFVAHLLLGSHRANKQLYVVAQTASAPQAMVPVPVPTPIPSPMQPTPLAPSPNPMNPNSMQTTTVQPTVSQPQVSSSASTQPLTSSQTIQSHEVPLPPTPSQPDQSQQTPPSPNT